MLSPTSLLSAALFLTIWRTDGMKAGAMKDNLDSVSCQMAFATRQELSQSIDSIFSSSGVLFLFFSAINMVIIATFMARAGHRSSCTFKCHCSFLRCLAAALVSIPLSRSGGLNSSGILYLDLSSVSSVVSCVQ